VADLRTESEALAWLVKHKWASRRELREYERSHKRLIGAMLGELTQLRARVSAVESDAVALEAIARLHAELIAELSGRIEQIAARLDADGGNIQLLFERDQAKQALIVALQEQVSFLDGRISALETVSDDSSAQIALLQNQLQAATGDLQAQLNQKQARVADFCPPGSAIRQINADGTVACEVDDGIGQLQYVTFSSMFPVAPNTAGGGTKSCPTGYVMTGGGFSGVLPSVPVVRSEPVNNSWQVTVANGAAPAFVTVSVRCLALTQ
jgi:hypothetical protein